MLVNPALLYASGKHTQYLLLGITPLYPGGNTTESPSGYIGLVTLISASPPPSVTLKAPVTVAASIGYPPSELGAGPGCGGGGNGAGGRGTGAGAKVPGEGCSSQGLFVGGSHGTGPGKGGKGLFGGGGGCTGGTKGITGPGGRGWGGGGFKGFCFFVVVRLFVVFGLGRLVVGRLVVGRLVVGRLVVSRLVVGRLVVIFVVVVSGDGASVVVLRRSAVVSGKRVVSVVVKSSVGLGVGSTTGCVEVGVGVVVVELVDVVDVVVVSGFFVVVPGVVVVIVPGVLVVIVPRVVVVKTGAGSLLRIISKTIPNIANATKTT